MKQLKRKVFFVKGVVTDQGSNFKKCFKLLGVKPDKQYFNFNSSKYYVFRDPPHLLKNARNLLLSKKGIRVPGHPGLASWNHIEALYTHDSKNSFKMAPKLTEKHKFGLKFDTKMKVKLAANVLSHSVAAALNTMVATNEIDSSAHTTSSFCQWNNDIFEFLYSLYSKDSVHLRRPLTQKFPSTLEFTDKAINWLSRLRLINNTSHCKFINGLIQSLNVVATLNQELSEIGIPFLCTRNLNQDNLEQFFGKIRYKVEYPAANDFKTSYTNLTVASLIRPPISGDCEYTESSQEFFDLNECIPQPESSSVNQVDVTVEDFECR